MKREVGTETQMRAEAGPGAGKGPSVARSAKYPRVAVLLGVDRKWYVPLVLCRALTVSAAVWWVVTNTFALWSAYVHGAWGSIEQELCLGRSWSWTGLGLGPKNTASNRILEQRLAAVQLLLAFGWVRFFSYPDPTPDQKAV